MKTSCTLAFGELDLKLAHIFTNIHGVFKKFRDRCDYNSSFTDKKKFVY